MTSLLRNDHLLRYVAFALVSFTGLVRISILPLDVLGEWRFIGSNFTWLSQILLVGLNSYILLNTSKREATLIFSGYFYFLFFIFLITAATCFYSMTLWPLLASLIAAELMCQALHNRFFDIKNMYIGQIFGAIIEVFLVFSFFLFGVPFTFELLLSIIMAKSIVVIIFLYLIIKDKRAFLLSQFSQGLKTSFSALPFSIRLNFFPMLASTFLMNADGLLLVYFVTNQEAGKIALLIFMRSLLLLPQSIAGQRLAKRYSNTTNISSVVVNQERLVALKQFGYVTIFFVFAAFALEYVKGSNALDHFLLVGIWVTSFWITALGPTQTLLQILKRWRFLLSVDISLIVLMILLCSLLSQDAGYQLFVYIYLSTHAISFFLKYRKLVYELK